MIRPKNSNVVTYLFHISQTRQLFLKTNNTRNQLKMMTELNDIWNQAIHKLGDLVEMNTSFFDSSISTGNLTRDKHFVHSSLFAEKGRNKELT